jgi:hypothetical protein
MAHTVGRMLGTMGRCPTRMTQIGVIVIGSSFTIRAERILFNRCHWAWRSRWSKRLRQGSAERVLRSKCCQYNSKHGKDRRRLTRLH